MALMDHMSGQWVSKYMSCIFKLREKVGMLSLPSSPSILSLQLNMFFLNATNDDISSIDQPALHTISSFKARRFLTEESESREISRFRYSAANIGYKAPLPGYPRLKFCVLCPSQVPVSEFHVLFCPNMRKMQADTGVSNFLNVCQFFGVSPRDSFALYVNGCQPNGEPVDDCELLSRGRALIKIVKYYVSKI